MMFINGTDDGRGVVIIGAHYDTVSAVNPASANGYQPGANDNGSGVAAVMEIARIMAQRPHRSTLVFVLFSSEELNRDGSRAFVDQFILDFNIPVDAVINLDIIGSPTGPNGERYDNQMRVFADPNEFTNSRHLARLSEFSARYFVPNMNVNVQPTIDRPNRWGDHEIFSNAGFPAIRLIEQADDFNLVHTTRDNTDDIEIDYLRRTTQVALATMIVLADGPLPPTNIRIDPTTWRVDWLPTRDADSYVVALRRSGSLTFNQELTVNGTTFELAELQNFETLSIASVDGNGQMGIFSDEFIIPTGQ